MKNLLLLGTLFLTLSSGAFAAVTGIQLDLASTSSVSPVAITSESLLANGSVNFSLDIDVQDLGSTANLAAFDITLSALPNGLTFDGYSNLVSGFVSNNGTGLHYSASANNSPGSTADDVVMNGTLQTILVANFTATKAGVYNIAFASPGAFMELSNDSAVDYSYTANNNTATVTEVTPEPSSLLLLALGLLSLGAVGLRQRAAVCAS